MSGVATAVVAAAVIGSVASNRASKKASDAQKKAAQIAADQTSTSTAQARRDLLNIFPSAQQAARQGFQGALDVFGQSLPAQTNVFQQGNVGAQQAILSGLPQIQNALLGGNVDFSQLLPFQAQTPDLSFFQQQLPVDVLAQQNAALNSGLGGFTPDNPIFDGLIGPFEIGTPSPLGPALGGGTIGQPGALLPAQQQLPANINAGIEDSFLSSPRFTKRRGF